MLYTAGNIFVIYKLLHPVGDLCSQSPNRVPGVPQVAVEAILASWWRVDAERGGFLPGPGKQSLLPHSQPLGGRRGKQKTTWGEKAVSESPRRAGFRRHLRMSVFSPAFLTVPPQDWSKTNQLQPLRTEKNPTECWKQGGESVGYGAFTWRLDLPEDDSQPGPGLRPLPCYFLSLSFSS